MNHREWPLETIGMDKSLYVLMDRRASEIYTQDAGSLGIQQFRA